MRGLTWLGIVVLLTGCEAASPPAPEREAAPAPPTSPAPPAAPEVTEASDAAPRARLERVIAVGDLHGDLDNALAVLQRAGLVDVAGAWSGGDAVWVQTGDTTDRGPDSKEILELVRRLEGEAEAAGGRVVALLGNHEVMNLTGDLRYVHPEDFKHFGGPEARAEALGPGGELGAWLRGLGIVALVDGVVYTHGGVTPSFARLGVEGANDLAAEVIAGRAPGSALSEGSPIWYRGYLQDDEETACSTLTRALAGLGAERMVVGHTTQRTGRIASRCGGRLLGIDTGISDHYGGHLAALELRAGDAWALYADGAEEDLPDPGLPSPP